MCGSARLMTVSLSGAPRELGLGQDVACAPGLASRTTCAAGLSGAGAVAGAGAASLPMKTGGNDYRSVRLRVSG